MYSTNNLSNRFNVKSFKHILFLGVLSFTLLLFAGCGSDNSTSPTNTDPDNTSNPTEEPTDNDNANEVSMSSSSYTIANLEVEAGTTVTWTNDSSVNHTVTSGTRGGDDAGDLFNSGTISPGGTFTFTFEEAGTFAYFCEFHAGMDAEVTVTE